MTTDCFDVAELPGLKELWDETLGDQDVCVAILDGPVDLSHRSLRGADLTSVDSLVPSVVSAGHASQHGTHIASIIFGQHERAINGIAPRCRGLVIPIFKDDEGNSTPSCSQLDLARTILQSIQHGAHIINISCGELEVSGASHPLLAEAIHACVLHNILLVGAVGNEGCDCLHIPSSSASALAVGAMDRSGEPVSSSNWGERYRRNGILAPGVNIPGAMVGGGIVSRSGTSYATSIVSGISALLLSLQFKYFGKLDPSIVRTSILSTAVGCLEKPSFDCRRLLAGRLNIDGAASYILAGGTSMVNPTSSSRSVQTSGEKVESCAELTETLEPGGGSSALGERLSGVSEGNPDQSQHPAVAMKGTFHATANTISPSGVHTSTCSCLQGGPCNCGATKSTQLVFALGQLGFGYAAEADRDSIGQHMQGNPDDPVKLLEYLDDNPWDAASVIWTLSLDATTIYAIKPSGSFPSHMYERLRQFLKEQLTEGVERISIGGTIEGRVKLMSGQIVPTISPEPRVMYSWTTKNLSEAVVGRLPGKSAKAEDQEKYAQKNDAVRSLLERVYYGLCNLGLLSADRALNYAVTNAMNVGKVFESALKEEMQLDCIEVEHSPLCRPDSDCQDVKLTFFKPRDLFQARKVYRFTVDVSRSCPVLVGPIRSWSVR